MAKVEGNSGIRAWCGQEKCRGLRGTGWHKMAGDRRVFWLWCFAALPVHGAAFSPYFKKLAQFAKTRTN